MGAILVQGMRPGAELFTKHTEATYTFIGGLFLANLLLLPVSMYLSNAFARVMYMPKEMLAVGIALLSAVGKLAIRGNVGDMFIMGILGLVTYFAMTMRFSPAPAVLGIVLGRTTEEGLTQSMMIGTAKGGLLLYFIGRPIILALMIATAAALAGPPTARWIKRLRARDTGDHDATSRRTITPGALIADRVVSLGLVALSIVVFFEAQPFGQYGSVFPLMVNGFLGAFAVLYVISSWFPRLAGTVVEPMTEADRKALWHGPTLLVGLIGLGLYLYALIPIAGFFSGSLLYAFGVVTVLRLRSGRLSGRGLASAAIFTLALAGTIQYIFANVSNVHLPPGVLI